MTGNVRIGFWLGRPAGLAGAGRQGLGLARAKLNPRKRDAAVGLPAAAARCTLVSASTIQLRPGCPPCE